MQGISKQLKLDAVHSESGPGLPTAIAIHSKFIAIGTSRSIVLVFDHFQVVQQVLQPTGGRSGESDGPVTAIDVSQGSDYLVCGYVSGRVILWDIMRGTTLKSTNDMHRYPVTSIKFCK